MRYEFLPLLRCPVSRTPLTVNVLETRKMVFLEGTEDVIWNGILQSEIGFVYPILNGIPRLNVEAYCDYASFFEKWLPNFTTLKYDLEDNFNGLLHQVKSKNKATKESFQQEWNLYDYDSGKTWELDAEGAVKRFFKETDENASSLIGKWVLDAGCGNGHLDIELGKAGVFVVGMDFSLSVERAFESNKTRNAFFVQGDVEYPPFDFAIFDLIHSSGVLIHTQRTELSLSCLVPCLKPGGKISIWSYQPRKDWIHQLINKIRRYSSRLPIRFQYYLYACTLFPISFVVKRLKGNKQSTQEMMIEILDWFSPQNRWEHEVSEVRAWFWKRNFKDVKVTDQNVWGFNLIGVLPNK